jgi:hypothetical protein
MRAAVAGQVCPGADADTLVGAAAFPGHHNQINGFLVTIRSSGVLRFRLNSGTSRVAVTVAMAVRAAAAVDMHAVGR